MSIVSNALQTRLKVSEIFGPTFQGEGPSLGTLCAFLRLANCNLACTWCDTPYTWDWTAYDRQAEVTIRTIEEVVRSVVEIAAPMLVITGGEPLLQQRQLVRLAHSLPASLLIDIETNGTVAPRPELMDRANRVSVSPKLANSGMELARRIRPPVLSEWTRYPQASFKFVVRDLDDLDEAGAIVDQYGLRPVYIMPEGRSAEEVLSRGRELANDVAARGWHLTTRMHVLLWGDARGV
jgi:7-cyano-7-deazaguanosine (preQ0) biosynthesis protein QueE